MKALYSTTVDATGGRSGAVRSADGVLDLKLAIPTELGGAGGATNPEQLFAAGYAACFGNAVIHITRNQQHKIKDDDVDVAATVGSIRNEIDTRFPAWPGMPAPMKADNIPGAIRFGQLSLGLDRVAGGISDRLMRRSGLPVSRE